MKHAQEYWLKLQATRAIKQAQRMSSNLNSYAEELTSEELAKMYNDLIHEIAEDLCYAVKLNRLLV